MNDTITIRRSFAKKPATKKKKHTEEVFALPYLMAAGIVIDQLLNEPEQSQRQLGQQLNITPARLTQLCNLTLLSPEAQQKIMTGEYKTCEKQLRSITATIDWAKQVRLLDSLCPAAATPDAEPSNQAEPQST